MMHVSDSDIIVNFSCHLGIVAKLEPLGDCIQIYDILLVSRLNFGNCESIYTFCVHIVFVSNLASI
jgi:hypothetical protein